MPANNERVGVIHFLDGTSLTFQFPPQASPAAEVGTALERALASRSVAVEMEGSLFIIPVTSIKSIQITPAPDPLPDTVIRSATLFGRG